MLPTFFYKSRQYIYGQIDSCNTYNIKYKYTNKKALYIIYTYKSIPQPNEKTKPARTKNVYDIVCNCNASCLRIQKTITEANAANLYIDLYICQVEDSSEDRNGEVDVSSLGI